MKAKPTPLQKRNSTGSLQPFILTDLEDRALAACEGAYLESKSVQSVLSAWYGRTISYRELRAIFSRLISEGFLRCYVKVGGRIRVASLQGVKTELLLLRATAEGVSYLGRSPRVVK